MPREPKRVLITGAGSGIGRALAVEAAKRGMVTALCGRRKDALEGTLALLGCGQPHLIVPVDITNGVERRQLADHIAQIWQGLDVLINNAGVVEGGSLGDMSDEALGRTFATNVIAPMALTRDFMPLLAVARPSRVVNVGSVFGDIPYPQFSAYSASKFALRGFSIAIRREWKDIGIGVTYVAPRATQTDALAAFESLLARSKMNVDPPDRVARLIWRAVENGDNTAYAPGPERLYVLIQRLFPRLIDRALARLASAPAI